MSQFTENINIAPLPKENKWTTTKPVRFYLYEEGIGDYVDIPAGFQFDGASIPRVLWLFFPPVEPKTITPAAFHDYIVQNKKFGYFKTQWLFYIALRISGNSLLKSGIFLIGVILGCWIPYYFRTD